MENIFANVPMETIIIFALNFLLILILFIMNLSNRSKIRNLKSKYNKFMSGLGERGSKGMEELLENYIEKVVEVKNKSREIENHINYIERNLLLCIQKIGIVRYSAFENVGSDLSFAIALLDSQDNGVVINGIYARDGSSTYTKPIVSGKSKYPLSAEEMQALDIAKKTYSERLYTEK